MADSAQNRGGATKVMPMGKRFQKGAPSANPGGRPRAIREIVEMCREAGPDIIARLVSIARNSPDEMQAIAASKELLNRGFGKSENLSTIKLDTGSTMTDEELTARIAELEAKGG